MPGLFPCDALVAPVAPGWPGEAPDPPHLEPRVRTGSVTQPPQPAAGKVSDPSNRCCLQPVVRMNHHTDFLAVLVQR